MNTAKFQLCLNDLVFLNNLDAAFWTVTNENVVGLISPTANSYCMSSWNQRVFLAESVGDNSNNCSSVYYISVNLQSKIFGKIQDGWDKLAGWLVQEGDLKITSDDEFNGVNANKGSTWSYLLKCSINIGVKNALLQLKQQLSSLFKNGLMTRWINTSQQLFRKYKPLGACLCFFRAEPSLQSPASLFWISRSAGRWFENV